MLGPLDLVRLGLGKWVQLRGHHVDLTIGDLHIQGTIDADFRIGEDIKPAPVVDTK